MTNQPTRIVQRHYTVILKYPDYMSCDQGTECYISHQTADTAQEAVKRARRDVHADNGMDFESGESEDDFEVLYVLNGYAVVNDEEWN